MLVIVMQVRFRNPIKYKQDKEMFIAPEGLYSGQVQLRWPYITMRPESRSLTLLLCAVRLLWKEGNIVHWQCKTCWRHARGFHRLQCRGGKPIIQPKLILVCV